MDNPAEDIEGTQTLPIGDVAPEAAQDQSDRTFADDDQDDED